MDLNSIRRYRQVSQSLQPEQKVGMRMALIPFLMRGGLLGSPFNIRRQASSVLRLQFPRSSPGEIGLLSFCFLTRLAAAIGRLPGYDFRGDGEVPLKFKGKEELTYEEACGKRDSLRDARNSMDELNAQDMLFLQRAMETKSQLESMISNVMQASGDAENSLASNLKAS